MTKHEEERLLRQIDEWWEQDEHEAIVQAVLALPPEQRSDALLGQLAVAYNNLGQYGSAIEILEGLQPRQQNAPEFHYRLGYAYYYSTEAVTEKEELFPLLAKARQAFEQSLILRPSQEIAQECEDFLGLIIQKLDEIGAYDDLKRQVEGKEPEVYTDEEMTAVEEHLARYFGSFDRVLHELYSPDIHVDICVIPPGEGHNYLLLSTMGMGAHCMAVPEELAEYRLERAEVMIALPPDWPIASVEERWYWPIRLLKNLARMPGEMDTWLAWGHTVDNGSYYAEDTELCGCILVDAMFSGEEGCTCILPGGEPLNFYVVLPLYREEMDYKRSSNADSLLDRLFSGPEASPVLNKTRQNCCKGFVFTGDSGIVDWEGQHLESIEQKHLPVEPLMACAHIALYLRWCIEQDMMAQSFCQKYPAVIRAVKEQDPGLDLREFLHRELGGTLYLSLFGEKGAAFTEYYYQNVDDPHYPADVDSCAMNYFGEERYNSDEFQDEAYLFMPYDGEYYRRIKVFIDFRYAEWAGGMESGLYHD